MIYEQLEANMVADVGRGNSNSVMNELKTLGIKFPKARPGFAKVFNRFEELSRQLREGEIARPQALKVIRTQLISAIADYVTWAVGGEPETNPGYEQELPENDNLNPGVGTQVTPDNLLLKFESSRASLQAQLVRHHHVVAYAPIIPMTNPSLLKDKLNKFGIKNDSFNYYTILERQLVIGMSNEFMQEKKLEYSEVNDAFQQLKQCGQLVAKYRLSEKEKNNSSDATRDKYAKYLVACDALKKCAVSIAAQRKSDKASQEILSKLRGLRVDRSAKDRDTSEHLAFDLTKLLKQTRDTYDGVVDDESLMATYLKSASAVLKKELTQFGSRVNYLNATWIWALTQKEINVLQSCAFSGHFKLARWGFSFTKED